MKTIAYFPIHYGKEYLGYSIKSIYDHVDLIAIFYTVNPSYGHTTEVQCPEHETELQMAARKFGDPQNKIRWVRGYFTGESHHRGSAVNWCHSMDAEIILACDYDEVWHDETLKEAIEFVKETNFREYRVPMHHLWRSFDHICRDLAQPVRFVRPNAPEKNENDHKNEGYVPIKKPVYHFGYAIRDELMRYKWQIHGHKNELRPNWFEEVWEADRREDVHPTNENFWTPEPFPKEALPAIMEQHPYWGKEKIG